MTKTRLGVNIDHVATIRNARGETYPDPLKAALLAQKSGADSITIHLREDRRHIRDKDLKNIKKKIKIPLNLEMAPTKEMLNIAIKHKPNFVCIVPCPLYIFPSPRDATQTLMPSSALKKKPNNLLFFY